ncbi:alpha/beta fold hydrolase [Streptomyces corynorhini]|uniref:Alpha/beta hydrolase n=1 Tax=Streptomyces corynorhini TaxID=2282652 RepID=A0A370BCV5_9ACTN|nr:alpha/beta hydrolase [Streptomyces corynorhini]RDG38502.1 alpha/beta hydrolase [Streptomyces corynorhini]
MTWTERVVEREGVRLVCRDRGGDGPGLVLLHGLAGHAGEWDASAGPLSEAYRVVAIDQRGQGASDRFPSDVSRDAFVEDVVAVVDQLGLERVVLVGQSMGGHAAILAAARHPETVRALVVVEADVAGPDAEWPGHARRWFDSWPASFPSYDAAVRFFGGGAIGRGWADGLEERGGRWWPRFDRDVLVRSVAEAARHSFAHEWERVTCPTLLILAESSFISPSRVDELMRRRVPDMSVSVPGTRHDLHLERPGAVCDLISRFLAGLSA